MNKAKVLWFILLPAMAIWLGWGIRGQIGHSTGAMIPGAFAALALCMLLPGKQFSRGLVVALTAVGFGFGADMTTMQTAGMVMHTGPGSIWLGYAGLAIKGALWSLFGGAGLGLALAASRYRRKDIVLGVVFMLAGFYAGWALIDQPKRLYLSVNRSEIWFGLLIGAVVLLAWLTVRGRTRIPLWLGLCAAAAGAIGYPVSVTLASAGLHSSFGAGWIDWWNAAETTYGFFMGAGIGVGTYLLLDYLPEAEDTQALVAKTGLNASSMLLGIVLAASCTALYETVAPWILLGSFLLVAAYYSEKLAWHIGVTLTFGATAANVVICWLYQERMGNAVVLWALAVLATVVVSWKAAILAGEAGKAVVHKAFVFMIWAILILSCLKTFVIPQAVNPPAQALAAAGGWWPYMVRTWGSASIGTEASLAIVGILLTWVSYRILSLPDTPAQASSQPKG